MVTDEAEHPDGEAESAGFRVSCRQDEVKTLESRLKQVWMCM